MGERRTNQRLAGRLGDTVEYGRSSLPSASFDYEFGLLDLWDAIVRRKLWFLSVLLISLVAAATYLLVAPPVFEVGVKLRVGHVGENGFLEDPEVLSSKLMREYGEEIATGLKREPPFLEKAALQRGGSQVLDVVARGKSPEQAAEFLARVMNETIVRHQNVFHLGTDLIQARIDQIELQRDALKSQIADTAQLIDAIKQRDPVQASLLAFERGRAASELSVVESQLPELKRKLTPPAVVMTSVLGGIDEPAKAVAPKRGLVLALAALVGIIAGLALAILPELIARSRSLAAARHFNAADRASPSVERISNVR